MNATNDPAITGHNRTIRFSEIPDEQIKTLDVRVNYVADSGLSPALVLDGIILPQIMRGLRLAELFQDMDLSEVEEMMRQMGKFTPNDDDARHHGKYERPGRD